VIRFRRAASCALLALSCAAAPRAAPGPLDWGRVDARWSVHLVTREPDGGERVTRVRLATLRGVGFVRTGRSRWRSNLARDPRCRLRVGGVDHALRAFFVTEPAARAAIDAAFLAKYGWQERLFDRVRPDDVAFVRLDLVAATP